MKKECKNCVMLKGCKETEKRLCLVEVCRYELERKTKKQKETKSETRKSKLIFVCSPYRSDTKKNTAIAQNICRAAVSMGFIPIAPHLYFPQFLDEWDESERLKGISCGLELLDMCSELWIVGTKITDGMQTEINHARRLNIPIKFVPEDLKRVINQVTVK